VSLYYFERLWHRKFVQNVVRNLAASQIAGVAGAKISILKQKL